MYIKAKLKLAALLLSSQLFAQADLEKKIQTQLILAENGSTIELPEGKIELAGSLSLDAKKGITIRGKGQGKTVLSFKNQKQGAEGLRVTNSQNIVLEDFTIENSKGDLIKTQSCTGVTYRNITAQWTGKPKPSNGAYALYPVQCTRVVIENCTAIGASDAGIYAGQSDSVWVRGCTAIRNVAGIEIENTTNAWVSDNLATENSGGILVFDLPDLPFRRRGGNCEVWNNRVIKNNHKNFAPKGNIVGKVPPGTGIMLLASNHTRVHDNLILDNRTASCAIVSYHITEIPLNDRLYQPYPSAIEVTKNIFSKGKRMPTWKNKMGFLFWLKFKKKVPHILYDGILNPDWTDGSGVYRKEYKICITDNQNGTFANLKADKKFKGISKDLSPYECVMRQ